MRPLLIGAAGMIGRKPAARVAATGAIGDGTVTTLTPADVIELQVASDFNGKRHTIVSDLSSPGTADRLNAGRPDVISRLAAIVCGEAEVHRDNGSAIDLDAPRALFDAIGSIDGYVPRPVYASPLAVFGAPFPDRIGAEIHLTPLTSSYCSRSGSSLRIARQ